MAVRTGMAALIQELRMMTNAGTADKTIGAETYWSDQHLQDWLDMERKTFVFVALEVQPVFINNGWQYFEYAYDIPCGGWVEYGAADSGFAVKDYAGSVIASGWSVNLNAQRITFSMDQANAVRYLDCRSYDLNAVAAQIWEHKASWAANNVDWSSDNHNVRASQEYQACMERARQYRNRVGMTSSVFWRADEA